MKKIILSAALGLCIFAAQADEQIVVSDEATVECGSPFDGLYFGIGAGGSFGKNKVDGSFKADKDDKDFQKDFKIKDEDANNFGGAIIAGGGKTFAQNKFYVGGEIICNISGSKKTDIKQDGELNVGTGSCVTSFKDKKIGSVESGAFTPELALKVGYVHALWDALFYFKPAAVFIIGGKVKNEEIKYTDASDEAKVVKAGDTGISGVTGSFTLGFEKVFQKKFSGGLEVGYTLKKTKKYDVDGLHLDVKETRGGINVRVLGAYHIKCPGM